MDLNKRHSTAKRPVAAFFASLPRARMALILLPFLALGAYLADLPLALPAFILPARSYLALSSDTDREAFADARGRGEAYVVLPGRLRSAPAAGDSAGFEELRDMLPDFPVLESALKDIEGGAGLLKKGRLVVSRMPSAEEIGALRAASDRSGMPVSIQVLKTRTEAPLLAMQRRYAPKDPERRFELLLAPEARAATKIELRIVPSSAGNEANAGRGEGRLIFASSGSELPKDLALRFALGAASPGGAEVAELTFAFADGSRTTRRLDLGGEETARPNVLVISQKAALASYVERSYTCARTSPAEASTLDLYSYELIVLDGLALRSIEGPLLSGLLGVAERRTGSLLFVADSPDFGTKGANPALEAILPAALLPRSLKDLPDIAVLILVDASGSMFGDKLSLAKVTGLELLRALKPGDLAGLGLFSDRRRWVYGFAAASGLEAAPALAPLTAGGGTDLYAALVDGLDRISHVPIKQKHAVVITDGVTKPADFRVLAERARALGVTISAMGVGEDADRPFLERLALGTGGRYYPVSSAEEIPSLIFEDRSSVARPAFAQGRIPILALNGDRVATIGGMAQYTATPAAEVILANDLGDPLLASRQAGNRAVLLFTSDIYGSYTQDLFASREAAGAFRDRLDALFAERPAQASVTETARGIAVLVRGDRLVAPRLLLSRAGNLPIEAAFRKVGAASWSAELSPHASGRWNATILDRGSSLASFPLAVNGGMAGERADAVASLADYHPSLFRVAKAPEAWLVLFFAASIACTIMLRARR
jgi:hypothetical protein